LSNERRGAVTGNAGVGSSEVNAEPVDGGLPGLERDRRRLLRFLRKLPHDFANAILPFQIAGDLLRRADGDAATLDQVRRILDDQSVQAQRLVDDLDRTVQVLRGEIDAKRRLCDLETTVARGIAAARGHAPPSIEVQLVSPPAPIEVEADPKLLAAAIEELVANAARFAGTQPIRVELERTADAALVRVRDRGPGIADGRLEAIFEPFVAADTVESGWGIGLSFVRLVAATHGGSIAATPAADGNGLVMTLCLVLPS
jgi:signal transduction histidine kinase